MSYSYKELDAEVIIIGAGLAGLIAALTLLEREPTLEILILEAKDIVGGCLSKKFVEIDYNLYDDVFFPPHQDLLTLLDKIDLTVEKRDKTHNFNIIFDYGKGIKKIDKNFDNLYSYEDSYEMKEFLNHMNSLCLKQPLDDFYKQITMEDFIHIHLRTVLTRKIMKYLIYLNCKVPAKCITVDFYIFYCSSCGGMSSQFYDYIDQFYVLEGAQEICERIIELIGRHLCIFEENVIRIITSKSEVEIITNTRSYFSRYAIISIHPTHFKNIEIPDFSENFDLIKSTPKEELIKFVAAYWNEKSFSGEVFNLGCDQPIIYCFHKTSEMNPTIIGYYKKSSIFPDIHQSILDKLSHYFSNNDLLNPLQFVEYCVEEPPLICFDSFKDFLTYKEQKGRLYFAGAETSTEQFGHIVGEVLSGKRAALETLLDLRPQAINRFDLEVIRKSNISSKSIQNIELPFLYKIRDYGFYILLGVIVVYCYKSFNKK